MFKKIISLVLLPLVFIFLSSCGKSKVSNLKELQAKQTGDYLVALLNESGSTKQGSNVLYLEFRKSSDKQLVDVGKVSVNSVMQMAGSPMTGETTITNTDTPGRYEVKGNFQMSGAWNLTVSFGNSESVKFSITVL